MTDARLAELDALSTEDLRQRAFVKARERRDLGFFWDLFTHIPHGNEDTQDGWLGSFASTFDDAAALWREVTDHNYGEAEPIVRARFIDYLLES